MCVVLGARSNADLNRFMAGYLATAEFPLKSIYPCRMLSSRRLFHPQQCTPFASQPATSSSSRRLCGFGGLTFVWASKPQPALQRKLKIKTNDVQHHQAVEAIIADNVHLARLAVRDVVVRNCRHRQRRPHARFSPGLAPTGAPWRRRPPGAACRGQCPPRSQRRTAFSKGLVSRPRWRLRVGHQRVKPRSPGSRSRLPCAEGWQRRWLLRPRSP